MGEITLKDLLEAGVHFGHQTKRWNPKMKPFIFMDKNGIHIIDLQKTILAIKEAYEIVRQSVLDGKSILFVGTKKQAQQAVENEAQRCGMYYVNNRWLGGMLTNFHQSQSTLYILVCTFAGYEFARDAYKMAIENEYRFFSYGDAMLIF